VNIISFNQLKREALLMKAEGAHKNRQYQQAYDYLREALRFGENAAIFLRAASILNEMGEYQNAAQLAKYALQADPNLSEAKWELAVAYERLWKIDEALALLHEIESFVFNSKNDLPLKSIHLFGMCYLKSGDLNAAKRILFRGAVTGTFPEPLISRLNRIMKRFESLNVSSVTSLKLADWIYIMHGNHLLLSDSEGSTQETPFRLEYFDLGKILWEFEKHYKESALKYSGILPIGPHSMSVAKILSEILNLPILGSVFTGKAPVLICALVNVGFKLNHPFKNLRQHDVFILVKHFEREEFYDAVSNSISLSLNSWPESFNIGYHQIIGVLGRRFVLPWEKQIVKTDQKTTVPEVNIESKELKFDLELDRSIDDQLRFAYNRISKE
jgi:hypothetical protein